MREFKRRSGTTFKPAAGTEFSKICDTAVTPSASSKAATDVSELKRWSGARDLTPGPHGPELVDIPANDAGFCALRFQSSGRSATAVQISTNLQPDYYMKYDTD